MAPRGGDEDERAAWAAPPGSGRYPDPKVASGNRRRIVRSPRRRKTGPAVPGTIDLSEPSPRIAVKTLKTFWTIHKWAGIVLALLVALVSVTGFLLLVKKDFAWLQPPTERGGAAETAADFLPIDAIFAAAAAHAAATGTDGFAELSDIDRVDFRPGRGIHKIRSKATAGGAPLEIQVDAVTGEVLAGPGVRRSDLIERIHDGSFFGDWAHGWLMPAVAIGLLLLTFSGLWIWMEPIVKRRSRRRRAKALATAPKSR